jgi:hypothetical protein
MFRVIAIRSETRLFSGLRDCALGEPVAALQRAR